MNIINDMAWTLFDGLAGMLALISANYALPPEAGVILIPVVTVCFTLALVME